MTKAKQKDEDNKAEARAILKSLEGDGQTFLTRTVGKVADEPDDDPRLLFWGRLIGRSLGLGFVAYLIWSLYKLYLSG